MQNIIAAVIAFLVAEIVFLSAVIVFLAAVIGFLAAVIGFLGAVMGTHILWALGTLMLGAWELIFFGLWELICFWALGTHFRFGLWAGGGPRGGPGDPRAYLIRSASLEGSCGRI